MGQDYSRTSGIAEGVAFLSSMMRSLCPVDGCGAILLPAFESGGSFSLSQNAFAKWSKSSFVREGVGAHTTLQFCPGWNTALSQGNGMQRSVLISRPPTSHFLVFSCPRVANLWPKVAHTPNGISLSGE